MLARTTGRPSRLAGSSTSRSEVQVWVAAHSHRRQDSDGRTREMPIGSRVGGLVATVGPNRPRWFALIGIYAAIVKTQRAGANGG